MLAVSQRIRKIPMVPIRDNNPITIAPYIPMGLIVAMFWLLFMEIRSCLQAIE